jgi:3-oxoacyl-[acyl-carrier protein] reductase
MDLELAGKTALITGASKGIGRAAAERLAAEGANLVLVSRTATDLAAAKAAIAQQAKVQIDIVAADLSQSSAIERLAKDFPAVDILVNNAGAIPGGQLLDVDEATWRKAWDLKVFGYINMCRAYYALMKERGSGIIINVTGNAAQTHDPEYICGVAGNAALTAFSQSLGSISVRHGIRVISLNPGPVETERLVNLMKKKAKDRTGNADNWRELFKPLPFGRGCAPDKVGAMIAFLASERCSYNSGSIVTIDAGLSARTLNF